MKRSFSRWFLSAFAALSFVGANASADDFQVHKLPNLPEPIASFGAAVAGNQLYVYGGHIGESHVHSIDNLSKRFQRLDLSRADAKWEDLPSGTPLQSPALVAHGDSVIRVGGMIAKNRQGEAEDMHSVAEVERYDAAKKQWTKLPSLPEHRSSHDAVVIGDTLYVFGGWILGENKGWLDTAWKLDLKNPVKWEALPQQPFQRRALTAAVMGDKVHIVGGLTPERGASTEVNVFDTKTGKWSQVAKLPDEGRSAGFGAAACAFNGRMYATTMDGAIHRLAADGQKWEPAGKLEPSRFLHRLVPTPQGILCVAGASMSEGHLDSVVRLEPVQTASTKSAKPATVGGGR